MENTQVTTGMKLFTPTRISKLALEFITLCEEDPILMERVYQSSMALMGVPTSSEVVSDKSTKENVVEQKKEEKRSSPTALTPDEVRVAKENFRQKMGLKSLTPQQAKMAKDIFRTQRNQSVPESIKVSKNAIVPSGSPRGSSPFVPTKTTNVVIKEVKPRLDERIAPKGEIPQIASGSRQTWNVKMKHQRQRALERSVELEDKPSDIFQQADYYNARITLEDTWNRFQNTWDCSGKKSPLQELPPLPDWKEIQKGFKQAGLEFRQHQSGHIILQDERTGSSLRPKESDGSSEPTAE